MKTNGQYKNVLIAAHRGLSSLYPENTLIAFKKAIELGVDVIELDISKTKDSKIIVLHDETIDRTTEGHGKIEDLTFKEARKYSAGKWFDGRFKDERIPLLEEVFEVLDNKTGLIIEVKQPDVEEEMIKLAEKHKMADRIICDSFNFNSIVKVQKISPRIPTCFSICEFEEEKIPGLIKEGIKAVSIEFHNITLPIVKKLHFYGFVINAWTVNRERDMENVLGLGVDCIITNYPQRLKKIAPR